MRLELSLQLQKIFQEMLYMLDWMDEIKVLIIMKDVSIFGFSSFVHSFI